MVANYPRTKQLIGSSSLSLYIFRFSKLHSESLVWVAGEFGRNKELSEANVDAINILMTLKGVNTFL